jgi:PhzF family phenazine biosynthesis protein
MPPASTNAALTTMTKRRFAQIDVFTKRAGYGNPVAVVLDADDLDTAAMQRFAAWTNLSETTFVLAPTTPLADFRVRIFTPRQELPFAGHPTVGTAYALLDARPEWRERERLTLECAAGLLAVRIEGAGAQRRIFVQAPEAKLIAPAAGLAGELTRALRAEPKTKPTPRLVDNGPRWLLAELADAAAVRSLQPDLAATAALTSRLGAVGVCVFGREPGGATAIAVRAFCPADGIPEDPVTGSANAAIGAFLHANDALETIGWRYTASQGREVGRDGYVDVEIDAQTGTVAIGGHCVSCIVGSLDFAASA